MSNRSAKETAENSLKPFVKWVGGKSQLITELEKAIPAKSEKTYTKYCEPMVGGGALFFKILSEYDFKDLYISDINPELVNAYRVVQRNAGDLIQKLHELQTRFLPMDEKSRKFCYYSIRDKFNSTSLTKATATEKAAYFIFLNKTCFNGIYRVNRKGQFNVPMGAYAKPAICDEENLRNINKALQRAEIVCGDYSLSRKFIDDNTFVYLDPPYRPLSETSCFTSYNAENFDDNEQLRLSKFFKKISDSGAKVILSNSDPKNTDPENSFFDELYKSYKIERVSATRMINSKADKRGRITELLISN